MQINKSNLVSRRQETKQKMKLCLLEIYHLNQTKIDFLYFSSLCAFQCLNMNECKVKLSLSLSILFFTLIFAVSVVVFVTIEKSSGK